MIPSPPSLRSLLAFPSNVEFYFWKQLGLRFTLHATMRSGMRLILRQRPSHDLFIAKEVFTQDVYKVPRPMDADAVKLIVDLGANVGYSLLHWLATFPSANILAFEPHPLHIAQTHRLMALNHLEARVELIEAAAGTQAGDIFLTDDGATSQIVPAAAAGMPRFPVRMVDFFQAVGGREIDLLKVDIEGGEYALLNDPRFAALPCKVIVLEWHHTPHVTDPLEYCTRRLQSAGYEVIDHRRNQIGGVLWAFKMGPIP